MSISLYFKASSGLVDSENLTLNMSNRNAADVLGALGFGDIWNMDAMEIPELQESCRLYQTSELGALVDGGIETTLTVAKRYLNSQGGCQIIDCGRSAGYIGTRVQQIADLCVRATEAGATHACFG